MTVALSVLVCPVGKDTVDEITFLHVARGHGKLINIELLRGNLISSGKV